MYKPSKMGGLLLLYPHDSIFHLPLETSPSFPSGPKVISSSCGQWSVAVTIFQEIFKAPMRGQGDSNGISMVSSKNMCVCIYIYTYVFIYKDLIIIYPMDKWFKIIHGFYVVSIWFLYGFYMGYQYAMAMGIYIYICIDMYRYAVN